LVIINQPNFQKAEVDEDGLKIIEAFESRSTAEQRGSGGLMGRLIHKAAEVLNLSNCATLKAGIA
jgi:hypothetical protein